MEEIDDAFLDDLGNEDLDTLTVLPEDLDLADVDVATDEEEDNG